MGRWCNTLTSIQKTSFELDEVCMSIDLEGFRAPTRRVERCLCVEGRRIDPYLWGLKSTFVARELGWCPVLHPSDTGSYQYDHALEKLDLPAHVRRTIQYAIHHVYGLAWHPPD